MAEVNGYVTLTDTINVSPRTVSVPQVSLPGSYELVSTDGATLADRYAAQVATGLFISEANAVHPNSIGSAYYGSKIAQSIIESIGI